MRLGARAVVTTAVAVAAWHAGAAFSAEADPGGGLAAGVFELVQEARRESGSPPLERRDALDRVAESVAREAAARPPSSRLSSYRPVSELLRDAGVTAFSRAVEQRFVMQSPDPLEAVRRQWQGSAEGWSDAVSPEVQAFGAGGARTEDGYLVLVVVLLQDTRLPEDLGALARRAAAAVNEARRGHGLPPLVWDEALAGVARAHSEDMARRAYLSHESPEGEAVSDRSKRAGIEYRLLAENLARNRNTEDPCRAAVEGWLDSPGHRSNILHEAVTHTGVGVALGADGAVYFTQVFVGK